jgi:hypothetical protein
MRGASHSKANSINPFFQLRDREALTISGGDGLFFVA